MNILAVDVGGSSVKLLASGQDEIRKFDSDPDLTPGQLVERVKEEANGWKYDVVSLGIPCVVGPRGPVEEPMNLGRGWIGFDYEKAFGVPVRVINDAAMQALGGYKEGRMLFLGLGTGLGTALIAEHVVVPLELGGLLYRDGESYAKRLGKEGLDRHGKEVWLSSLHEITTMLYWAFRVDEILLGGGNASEVHPLPKWTRRGGNEDAMTGGFRLWEERVRLHEEKPSRIWRVVS